MEEFEVVVIKAKSFFVFLSVYMGLGTILTAWFAVHFHSAIIGWIGVIVFLGFPAIFKNQFRRNFTERAKFIFSNSEMSVEVTDEETNSLITIDEIKYTDIESFRAIDSSKDDSSFLKITLRSETHFSYTILGQKRSSNDPFITDVVFRYFNSYNDTLDNKNSKIVLAPNLFATKLGRNLIVSLSVLLLGSLIVQLIYAPKSIPASLFTGLAIYLIILGQRKKDVELAKKLR